MQEKTLCIVFSISRVGDWPFIDIKMHKYDLFRIPERSRSRPVIRHVLLHNAWLNDMPRLCLEIFSRVPRQHPLPVGDFIVN